MTLRTDSFTEQGGPAATGFALGTTQATARATLGWRNATGDVAPTSILTFQGGSPFGISGTPLADDAAVVEVGLDVAVAPNVTLGLYYDGIIADEASDHGVNANFTRKF